MKALLPVFYLDVPGSSVNECGELVASWARDLIVYGADVGTLHFIHLSLQEYVSRNLDKISMAQYDHAFFARLCLNYLLSPEFQYDTPLGLKDLIFEYEFLKYAAVYWGELVRLCSEDKESEDISRKELTQLSVELLTQDRYLKLCLSVGQLLNLNEEEINHPLIDLWTSSSALHVAAAFGLLDVVKILVTLHPRKGRPWRSQRQHSNSVCPESRLYGGERVSQASVGGQERKCSNIDRAKPENLRLENE